MLAIDVKQCVGRVLWRTVGKDCQVAGAVVSDSIQREINMLPNFLLPESIARGDGMGPEIDLGSKRGKLLVLTLGITRIIEQESLEVSVWGSSDGENWGPRPLARFPPKFYCGLYSILLNLVSQPDVRFVHVKWKMSRWSKGETTPMFGFYLYAEESGTRVGAVAVA